MTDLKRNTQIGGLCELRTDDIFSRPSKSHLYCLQMQKITGRLAPCPRRKIRQIFTVSRHQFKTLCLEGLHRGNYLLNGKSNKKPQNIKRISIGLNKRTERVNPRRWNRYWSLETCVSNDRAFQTGGWLWMSPTSRWRAVVLAVLALLPVVEGKQKSIARLILYKRT